MVEHLNEVLAKLGVCFHTAAWVATETEGKVADLLAFDLSSTSCFRFLFFLDVLDDCEFMVILVELSARCKEDKEVDVAHFCRLCAYLKLDANQFKVVFHDIECICCDCLVAVFDVAMARKELHGNDLFIPRLFRVLHYAVQVILVAFAVLLDPLRNQLVKVLLPLCFVNYRNKRLVLKLD